MSRLITFFLIFLPFTSLNAQVIDSLKNVLDFAKSEARIVTLKALANAYHNNDWEEAVRYSSKSIEAVQRDDYPELLFDVYLVASKSYSGFGDYASALSYGEEALSNAFNMKDRADAFYQLGIIQDDLSEYEKALEYHLKSLEIRKGLGKDKDLIESNNAIAFVYRGMRRYDKAISMLEGNLATCKRLDYVKGMRRATFNIGLMKLETNQHADAIPYFIEATLGLTEEMNPKLMGSFYNNMANCYERLLHINPAFYDSALYYGKKNLVIKTSMNNLRGISNAHNGLAATYERASDYVNSGYHSREALRLADSLGFLPLKRNALAYLITSELGRNDVSHTNDHFEEYIDVVEELNELTSSRNLTELATKYETSKHLLENERLRQNVLQQSRIRLLLIALAIVLLLLVVLLVYLYLTRQRVATQLQKDKELITMQAAELRKMNDQKSRFFANISQGLRNPLSLINGYVDDLSKARRLPPEAGRSLGLLKRNAHQLALMVNDLLDLSKIDLDQKELTTKPAAIDDLLRRILAAFTSLAETRNVKLEFRTNQIGPTVGLVDEDAFEKVINHLIYKSFGQIESTGTIVISLSRVLGGLQIEILNDGTPIPQNELSEVFDRFSESLDSTSGSSGSLVGLSVSKDLLTLMGGEISVAVDEEDRTVFTLLICPSDEIPAALKSFDDEAAVDSQEVDFLNIPSHTTVLVVEDNDDLRQYLVTVLREHFKLLEASNGADALKVLETDVPDLILTDVMMPLMNGWELIESLQKRPAWSQIPIIILTAVAENQERIKGLRMGVDDYILKPFETDELLIRISNLVNNLRERIKWAKEFEDDDTDDEPLVEQHELVINIREHVIEHVADKSLNVLQLAMHLGLSERQLYRKTAESVGLSPSKLIQEIKMQHARELLISNSYDKLSQIAGAVGFESSSHFSKLYQERFGKKPTDYFS